MEDRLRRLESKYLELLQIVRVTQAVLLRTAEAIEELNKENPKACAKINEAVRTLKTVIR